MSACVKKYVFASVVIAVTVAVTPNTLVSQSFDNRDVFAVKPENYRYLFYGEYANTFDSARVVCTFGEVRCQTGSITRRLPLRVSERQWKEEHSFECRPGDTSQGRAWSLENSIRTANFAVPQQGGVIAFFRMANAENGVGCSYQGGTDLSNTPTNWRDAQVSVARGGWIEDTTTFIVELVNVTDATVFTLDSLALWGEAGSMRMRYGGSSLRSVEFSRQLPVPCYGDSVYVRFVAYRNGPTPAGVTARVFSSIVSYSTLYRDTSVTLGQVPRWASSAFTDSLYREYISQIIS